MYILVLAYYMYMYVILLQYFDIAALICRGVWLSLHASADVIDARPTAQQESEEGVVVVGV